MFGLLFTEGRWSLHLTPDKKRVTLDKVNFLPEVGSLVNRTRVQSSILHTIDDPLTYSIYSKFRMNDLRVRSLRKPFRVTEPVSVN